MRILIVGGGGREHALAWKLTSDSTKPQLYCAPGNAGTASLGTNLKIGAADLEGICDWCTTERPDLVVIGPEMPLCAGLTDLLEAEGIRVFGPNRAAARLEGSKQFAKEIMQAAGVPTAAYQTFTAPEAACAYVRERGAPVVIKVDGLAAGKGVTVAETVEQAEATVRDALETRVFGDAGCCVVIEDFLPGEEVSMLALIDGERVLLLASSQDYKRVLDKDQGPNTGGMGACSPVSIMNRAVLEKVKAEIYGRTLAELKKRSLTYKGVLYAGLMIENDQPSVLEFNCRFGDPETQALLVRWKGDMLPAINAVVDGTLADGLVKWTDEHSACVVMAAAGYPGRCEKGHEIQNIEKAGKVDDTVVFQAGTAYDSGKTVTAAGRVLSMASLGSDLKDALDKAYIAVETISFKGSHYRNDIGHRELRRTKYENRKTGCGHRNGKQDRLARAGTCAENP